MMTNGMDSTPDEMIKKAADRQESKRSIHRETTGLRGGKDSAGVIAVIRK